MNEREALKLALEALELEDMACRYEKDQTPEHMTKAIIAIKEALAQRTWVGLTDVEWEMTHWSPDFRAGAKWAEAKLKEKNT